MQSSQFMSSSKTHYLILFRLVKVAKYLIFTLYLILYLIFTSLLVTFGKQKYSELWPAVIPRFFLPWQLVSQQLQRELWDGSSISPHLQKEKEPIHEFYKRLSILNYHTVSWSGHIDKLSCHHPGHLGPMPQACSAGRPEDVDAK